METNPASADRTRPFTGKEFLESLRDGREIWIYPAWAPHRRPDGSLARLNRLLKKSR